MLEASPGIEPGCKDLQSSASPLRHEADQSMQPLAGRPIGALRAHVRMLRAPDAQVGVAGR